MGIGAGPVGEGTEEREDLVEEDREEREVAEVRGEEESYKEEMGEMVGRSSERRA